MGDSEGQGVRAEYAVLAEYALGFVRYVGAVEAGGIIRLAGALWADPAWRAEFDLVVDLTRARMAVGAEERRRMTSFFESYPLASRGRLAHIVSDDSLEYSRMSEALLPGPGRPFTRVYDLAGALVFLVGDRAATVEAALERLPLERVSLV